MKRRSFLSLPFVVLVPGVSLAQERRRFAALRILDELARIAANLRYTAYSHSTSIDERAGRYVWDCSAMATYVLRRAAPVALATVGSGRPVAAQFYRAIARAPTTRTEGGWLRIPRVADARPGDVFAWQRPPWFPSSNTGHVGFVLEAPRPSPLGMLLRIADSTRLAHDDDTRDTDRGASGFGQGTILFATDPTTGGGTGYGWLGARTPADWIIPTPIAIGRVTC
jgi:hypothetical protein